MASASVLWIFALLGLHLGSAKSFISMSCERQVGGQYGRASVLDCKIRTSEEVTHPEIVWLAWTKDGQNQSLLRYDEKTLSSMPGYSFADQSWRKSLDVSLRIQKTAPQHEGQYRCQVAMNSGTAKGGSSLQVTARYSVPTITSELTPAAGGLLECRASGGFPKGHIRWFDGDNKEVTARAQTAQMQTGEGLFQLSSRLPVPRGLRNCTCAVFSASGAAEAQTTFEGYGEAEGLNTPEKQNSGSGQVRIVAPVVVIGSLSMGLLLVLLVCRRREWRRPEWRRPEWRRPEWRRGSSDRRFAPKAGSFTTGEAEPAGLSVEEAWQHEPPPLMFSDHEHTEQQETAEAEPRRT